MRNPGLPMTSPDTLPDHRDHPNPAQPTAPGSEDLYPNFYRNPVIRTLASAPRWTVSGQLDDRKNPGSGEPRTCQTRKAPIDIRELQRLRGTFEKTANCLMTLDELVAFLPNAANHAYALNTHIDRVMILDIEKSCPPELAKELLALPALYSELSMSGRGYHLAMPLPSVFAKFPVAANKIALREEHGWYEVLLDHWITFTRTPIPLDHYAAPSAQPAPRSWDEIYTSLASKATQNATDQATKDSVSVDKPEIPGELEALHVMTSKPLPKLLEDFHGDHSRFEFSALSTLYHRLSPALPYLSNTYNVEYSTSMKAWLLYEAATHVLEHRAKHDQFRRGMPLLLNAATDLLARREAQRLTQEHS